MSVISSDSNILRRKEHAFIQDSLMQSRVVDWFSRFFIAPLTGDYIAQCQTKYLHEFFKHFEVSLNAQKLTQAIIEMFRHHSSIELEYTLNQQYVALFDGPMGLHTVYPYESYYENHQGRLFQEPYIEMDAMMNALDVKIASPCKEPPDHLALELAIFAEALRQGKLNHITAMYQRLLNWVPKMNEILQSVGSSTIYAMVLELLVLYLTSCDYFALFENQNAVN